MLKLNENSVENMVEEILGSLGYETLNLHAASEAVVDAFEQERTGDAGVLLGERLRRALTRLNPTVPSSAIEEAVGKLSHLVASDLTERNQLFHRYLVEGVPVEYMRDGQLVGDSVCILSTHESELNDFLMVRQLTVKELGNPKRPDVVIFINGMPLVVMELKNPATQNATLDSAYQQLQTYKVSIPSLFAYNELCLISDGLEARVGSLTAGFSRFTVWKTRDGQNEAGRFDDQLSTVLHSLFLPKTLVDYVRYFVTFEKEVESNPDTKLTQIKLVKKSAAYHQYYAVNKAVEQTLRASGYGNYSDGEANHKAGVIWHTQGSGKSLTMLFFIGKAIQYLENPTILVINDRNDLDNQLFETFSHNAELLRQDPVQAESIEHLKELLSVASGGVVFSTIQKFMPADGASEFETFTTRENVIVVADEAHRTQYGFDAKLLPQKEKGVVVGHKIGYGFAKYIRDALPQATFLGFTGTPVEKTDVNTPQVFGNYIDIYDVEQAVEDKMTVRIYYESRLAKVRLSEEGQTLISAFDEELEKSGNEDGALEAKMKWAKLEAIVGNKERIANLAEDIVNHFEERQEVFSGKAMVVAMSRRIAVELYDAIVKIRPQWHHPDLDKGQIKVVMTGASSDGPEFEPHRTSKDQRQALALRFKDEKDPLKLVIVRDMWLTGFDAPCMSTLYIDKPMKDHNLMQAIARVNRVFKDKPGGLIVDYIGIATNLKKALRFYTESGGKGDPVETQEKAIEIMCEKIAVVRQLVPPSIFETFEKASTQDKLKTILFTEDHIMGLDDGEKRFTREVQLLSAAYALSKPSEKATLYAPEIAFYQAVSARINKFVDADTSEKADKYTKIIKDIVDSSVLSDEVVDVFDAAGMKKPDVSILSDEFLQEVEGMEHKNVALELLKKLLTEEIAKATKHNLVKSKSLMELLTGAIKRYQNNLLSTVEIIEELIKIAGEVRKEKDRGAELGLSEDELAFYDALETNDSAVSVLGDDQLRAIAREIAERVRQNATIDFTIKSSARAKIMTIAKRILRKYGYPPDKQECAVQLVMKQAEVLADVWANEK
ncbi:type I restriction endonuclease subunit R [Trueperella sp. LYQ141]|uniref:type I restriction endonuclease subunit R n=1 Tax=Trueperella sp. LYQ141 TaxID=3391058 RepID=UPI003983078D